MKKVLFAFEVFSIIALFISYLVVEINHEPIKQPRTVYYHKAAGQKTKTIVPESVSVNEQTIGPLPAKSVAALLKFPS